MPRLEITLYKEKYQEIIFFSSGDTENYYK